MVRQSSLVIILFLSILVFLVGCKKVDVITNSVASCEDTDNGKDYSIKGKIITSINLSELANDNCMTARKPTDEEANLLSLKRGQKIYHQVEECSGENCFLHETYCKNETVYVMEKYPCSSCKNGVCLE